jgi:hypothetical protein
MPSEIGLKFIASFDVWWIKIVAEDDIARLLQNAESENILPEERNVGGINVDKQQVKDTAQDNIHQYSCNNPILYTD